MKTKRSRSAPASREVAPRDEAPEASSAAAPGTHSRRRFLELVAAGSAALIADPLRPARARAATKTPAKVPAKPAGHEPAVAAEIKSQKDYLARSLKTIREYELPPGSDMAFEFRPLKARPPKKRAKEKGGRP